MAQTGAVLKKLNKVCKILDFLLRKEYDRQLGYTCTDKEFELWKKSHGLPE